MVKHLVWEEFWNAETPKGAPARDAFPSSCWALLGLHFSRSLPLFPSTESATDLEVAHSKQGMVSMLASR